MFSTTMAQFTVAHVDGVGYHPEMKPRTRRIFVDTEWTGPPWSARSELMWIGLADQEGRSWYGISSEVEIDPATNDFLSGAFRLIDPDEPRMSRPALALAVEEFCGDVDEFWAWIPTLESFAAQSGLGDEAAEAFDRFWNVDLQMLQALVRPWPPGWPTHAHDLNRAAAAAGVEIPPRSADHFHPRVHAEWNGRLFERIHAAGGVGAYAAAKREAARLATSPSHDVPPVG